MDHRLESFLAIRAFDEYLERLEDFAGLPMEQTAIKKEMELMDTDASYTRRKKDTLLQKRKRENIKRLQGEIDALSDTIRNDGPYVVTEESLQNSVEILYRYTDK